MRTLLVLTIFAFMSFAALAAAAPGATACDDASPSARDAPAAGVVAPESTDVYRVDGVAEQHVRVIHQGGPPTHGELRWTLRDRASGDVFATAPSIEIPNLHFAGVSPYQDFCLEVRNAASLAKEYVVALFVTPE